MSKITLNLIVQSHRTEQVSVVSIVEIKSHSLGTWDDPMSALPWKRGITTTTTTSIIITTTLLLQVFILLYYSTNSYSLSLPRHTLYTLHSKTPAIMAALPAPALTLFTLPQPCWLALLHHPPYTCPHTASTIMLALPAPDLPGLTSTIWCRRSRWQWGGWQSLPRGRTGGPGTTAPRWPSLIPKKKNITRGLSNTHDLYRLVTTSRSRTACLMYSRLITSRATRHDSSTSRARTQSAPLINF